MNIFKVFFYVALSSLFLINLCSIIYQNATEEDAHTVFYSVKSNVVNSKFTNTDHRSFNKEGKRFNIGDTFSGLDIKKTQKALFELKKIVFCL